MLVERDKLGVGYDFRRFFRAVGRFIEPENPPQKGLRGDGR